MSGLLTRTQALLMCATVVAAGCASTGATRAVQVQPPAEGSAGRAVLTEYVQKLPAGTAVRVARASGRSVRGTLMKATTQSLFVQPKTRLPEPIVEIPMDQVLSVIPETRGGNHIGRAISAGAAAGAGAALAVFLVILAAFGD
jgi:hypothetical protein